MSMFARGSNPQLLATTPYGGLKPLREQRFRRAAYTSCTASSCEVRDTRFN